MSIFKTNDQNYSRIFLLSAIRDITTKVLLSCLLPQLLVNAQLESSLRQENDIHRLANWAGKWQTEFIPNKLR